MGVPDYYSTLELSRDATDDELKRAYRKLVIALHPDRHGGSQEATERFQHVVEAYSVLSDPTKRQKYDSGQKVRGILFEKGGNIQEFVGGFFDNVLGVRPRRKERGFDHIYRLALTLEEVAHGATRSLSIPSDETCGLCCGRGFEVGVMPTLCDRCDGMGILRRRKLVRSELEDCPDCTGRGYVVDEPCTDCGGQGTQVVRQSITIDIPSGVEDGARLLIRGAGQPGWQGGEKGDCWVHVSIASDPYLKREGLNIICRRPVSALQAWLGAKVSVPSVEGVVRIKVPPQLADAPPLKMVGYGIKDASTGKRGDQLVFLDIEMPESLTDTDMRKLRELQKVLGESVFPRTSQYEDKLLEEKTDD